jgi:hypothetical protein
MTRQVFITTLDRRNVPRGTSARGSGSPLGGRLLRRSQARAGAGVSPALFRPAAEAYRDRRRTWSEIARARSRRTPISTS